MNDILLDINNNSLAGKLVSGLGLPIPQKLKRYKDAWPEQPLRSRLVTLGGGGDLHPALAECIFSVGADVSLVNVPEKPYLGQAEAYARTIQTNSENARSYALIYDATKAGGPADLTELYEFFNSKIRSLGENGRVIVLGRPPESLKKLSAAAAARSLEGFVRSLSKEIGRKGATANLIYVQNGAEDRLQGALRFFLTEASVFVTGQKVEVSKAVSLPKNTAYTRPLEGKNVLLTGAARGIGAVTAGVLAQEGARLILLDRPEDAGALAKVAKETGGLALLQNIAEEGAPGNIRDFIKKEVGGLDVVIHNAGVTRDKTIAKMSRELWQATLNINLQAIIDITEELLEDGLNDNGRIVCLSSIAGIAGNFGQTNYATSKAGVIGFVNHLSKQVAKKGITVNAVAPGFIETRMTSAIPIMTREAGRWLSNLSQGGQPEDVGQAITFLSTPGSAGLTGQVIRVCGGNLLGA